MGLAGDQHFKIEIFERDEPGGRFPWFEGLSGTEAAELRFALASKVGLEKRVDPLELTLHIHTLGEVVPHQNAEDDSFDIRAVLESYGIESLRTIYINWYRYDDIDRMGWEDFATYFHDIWYPSSDDIEVFDDSLSWILEIAHYGEVKLVRLRGAQDRQG